ncbi:MAG: hypothetical protein ABIJ40_04105 [Bacteroidota bacterium]
MKDQLTLDMQQTEKADGGHWQLTRFDEPELGKPVLVFNTLSDSFNVCELVNWDNKKQWYNYDCTEDLDVYDYWRKLPDEPESRLSR